MKLANITLGLAVGVLTGVSLVLSERQQPSLGTKAQVDHKATSDISSELDLMSLQMSDIKTNAVTIKEDGTEFAKTIGDDIKKIIGEFKADITPNIERLQGHIENLQNRGEEMTNFPTKKWIYVI